MNQEFYIGINQGEKYWCDRCNTQPLTEREYVENFMKNGCRYCDECRCWMKLQKFKCIYCLKEWSHRGERLLPFECECGGLVCRLK